MNEQEQMASKGDVDKTIRTALTPFLPYAITDTAPPLESPVNDYFANMGMNNSSPLSSKLESDYNAAKETINNLLNINPISSQFGFSTDPYGGLLASNLQTNPFNVDYLKTRGLI